MKTKTFQFSICLVLLLSMNSCKDKCDDVVCENGAICAEGICECLEGYEGLDCSGFDSSKVQMLLDSGNTPFELFQGGVPLDSLFGKIYMNGFIFHLDTDFGTGLIAALEDQHSAIAWGCPWVDLEGLNTVDTGPPLNEPETVEGARIGDGLPNTLTIIEECDEDDIAARICQQIGEEWFLPSRAELRLMYDNLHTNLSGNFRPIFYLSSTEVGKSAVSAMNFSNGSRFHDTKSAKRSIRAARAF